MNGLNFKNPTFQLGCSAAGIFAAYALFQISKSRQGKSLPGTLNGKVDGLDPNFPGGKPIAPGSSVDSHDFKKPSCQIFNEQNNLFENLGNADLDLNQDKCFLNTDQTQIIRYVDIDGNLHWRTNALEAAGADHGSCFFWDSQKSVLWVPPSFGTYTPPDRSQRLCFAAGTSVTATGFMFATDANPNVYWWNPNVPFGDFTDNIFGRENGSWYLLSGTALPRQIPSTVDQCQRYVQLVFKGNGQQPVSKFEGAAMFVYLSLTEISGFTDVPTCMNNNSANRLWMPSQNKIVYRNTYGNAADGTLFVEFPLLPLN